jgi:hypothetical protein
MSLRIFRKDWTSAGNRASLIFRDPAEPAFAPVRGFGGGGARCHSNRTKDIDNVTQKAVVKQAQPGRFKAGPRPRDAPSETGHNHCRRHEDNGLAAPLRPRLYFPLRIVRNFRRSDGPTTASHSISPSKIVVGDILVPKCSNTGGLEVLIIKRRFSNDSILPPLISCEQRGPIKKRVTCQSRLPKTASHSLRSWIVLRTQGVLR